MVSGRSQRTVEAKRDPWITSCRAMEAVLVEKSNEQLLLRTGRSLWSILQASERPDHGQRLRYEETAPLAGSEVGIKPMPLDRIKLALEEGRDRVRQLATAHLSRRRHRPSPENRLPPERGRRIELGARSLADWSP